MNKHVKLSYQWLTSSEFSFLLRHQQRVSRWKKLLRENSCCVIHFSEKNWLAGASYTYPFFKKKYICISVHSHLFLRSLGFTGPRCLKVNYVNAILLSAYADSGGIVRTPLTNLLRVWSTPGQGHHPTLDPYVGPPSGPVTSLGFIYIYIIFSRKSGAPLSNHELQLFKDQSFWNKSGAESWRCNIFERECCIVLCSDSLSFWHSTASHCPELIVWRPVDPPCLFRSDAALRSAFSMSDALLFEILSRWQADTAGSAVSSSWGHGFFSSLSLDQPSSLTAFPFMFAVRVGADFIWFAVLLWESYSLDFWPVMLTFSLVWISPCAPACWRTAYYRIDSLIFDSFPFPSRLFGAIQHRVHTPWWSTTESSRFQGR